MRAKLAAVVAGSVAVPLALLSTLALRGEVPLRLLVACGVALGAYVATDRLIPAVQSLTLAAGLSGKDLCKRGTAHADKQIPESLGIVPGTVYLVAIILLQLMFVRAPERLAEYNAALLCICFILLLGFADDVLDLRWRYKLFLPAAATLPLLLTYSINGGATSVVVPRPLRAALLDDGAKELTALGALLNHFVTVDTNAHGAIVELGVWYLVYMGALCIFCTNAINIYAGINGLEVGQVFVIACAMLGMNLTELVIPNGHAPAAHTYAATLTLPLAAASLALLRHNWCPARVFVGDTYCYFAGMSVAVIAITAHFSKSLLLFFIPQLINFVMFDEASGLLHYSTIPAKDDPAQRMNLTLINLFLRVFGPMREESLTASLLAFQLLCCALGMGVRYELACWFYDCS